MKLKQKILIILLLLSAGAIAQTKNEIERQSLTYNEYLSILQKKLPELNRSNLSVETAEKDLLKSKSSTDTNFTGSGSYAQGVNYSTSLPGSQIKTNTWSINAGLSKKISATGTTIEAGTGLDRTWLDNGGYNYYTPSIYAKFTQSLLQNAFGVIDRFAENDARMKLDIEKIKKYETDKSYLNYYKKLYFTWVVQLEQLGLLKKSLSDTRNLETEIERKVKNGLTDRLDLQTVRALILQYEVTYSDAETSLASIESELDFFINTRTAKPGDDEFSLYFGMTGSNRYPYIAYETTRGAEIYRITKKNLSYTLDVQSSLLLPQLDLTGQYTRKGNYTGGATEAYSNINDNEYYLGFVITYPLSNSSGNAAVKDAEIAIKSINTEYEVSRKSYDANLNSAIKKIEGLKRSVSLTEKRIDVLESKYEAGYRQYLQSRRDLQFLVDTSLDITNEKISLIMLKNSLIQYSIDYADLTEGYQ